MHGRCSAEASTLPCSLAKAPNPHLRGGIDHYALFSCAVWRRARFDSIYLHSRRPQSDLLQSMDNFTRTGDGVVNVVLHNLLHNILQENQLP
jgi:hypothetical protein